MAGIKTASQAMNMLEGLASQVGRQTDELKRECIEQAERFSNVVKVAGARDDHAVEFLKPVRSELSGMIKWLGRVLNEIDEIIADPFGDERVDAARSGVKGVKVPMG